MPTKYDSSSDKNFLQLSWVLVGVALADRERIPEIEALLTDTANQVLPFQQRRILSAIIRQKGEEVWESLKTTGVDKDETNANERAIDAMIRTFRTLLSKHVICEMQNKLQRRAFHEDVDSFVATLQAMLDELPKENMDAAI